MTMKPFRTLCISAMLAATFAAPAFAAKVDDPSLYTTEALKKNLVLGKTTKEEVRAIYGDPDYVHRASAKEGGYETSWSYSPTESHGEKVRETVGGIVRGMLPGWHTGQAVNEAQKHGVGARNVKGYSLSVSYNAKGIVTDYEQTEDNNSKDSL